MSKIVDLINSLPDIFELPKASQQDINTAMLDLRVQFTDEYVEYLRNFGALIADSIELTGIAKADYRNVVKVTQQEWELNPKVPHNLYVIENTHVDGIIIWQDGDGNVYQSAPNTAPRKIASTLYEYIQMRMK